MQFEIWGMQWFPRGRGLPPTPRSPGVHSKQNLECTPLTGYFCSTHHLPSRRLGKKSLSLCRGVWSPVHWVHPPACTKITLNRVTSEKHTIVPNNILSSSLDRFEPQVQRLWGKLGPVWTGLKLFSCCTWILRYLPTGKHFPRVFRLVAHFVHFWSWA